MASLINNNVGAPRYINEAQFKEYVGKYVDAAEVAGLLEGLEKIADKGERLSNMAGRITLALDPAYARNRFYTFFDPQVLIKNGKITLILTPKNEKTPEA